MTRERSALILALALATLSCGKECDFADAVKAAAGAGAVDCGHVAINADPRTVTNCVRSSLEGGKPFFALYEVMGLDSHVADGIARSPEGVVTLLYYDGDAFGGGGDDHPSISAQVCEGVRLHVATSGDPTFPPPLDCSSLGPGVKLCTWEKAAASTLASVPRPSS